MSGLYIHKKASKFDGSYCYCVHLFSFILISTLLLLYVISVGLITEIPKNEVNYYKTIIY